MLLPIHVLLALCAAAGVISHIGYWSRHEFDEQVPGILLTAFLTHLALIFAFVREASLLRANFFATLLEVSYLVALFLSITIYRLFHHPLRAYPGPFWARLTQWWKVKHIAKAGTHYALIERLHQEHGDVVRIGPNTISINHVEALQAIYGSHSPCTKPPSYLIGGLVSVQSERDPHRHRLRRAVWDKALGSNVSNAFFPRMIQLTELVVNKLDEYSGQAASVNDWMHFITFDVMAQFVFSRDWNQLSTGKMHAGIKFASDYLKFAIYGTQVPWLALTLMKIPFAPEPQSAMMAFASRALDERIEKEPEVPDAISHLLVNKDPEAQQFLSRHDLESDVFMIQLAGADTSFSVLVNLCFRLAAQPAYQDQLRKEISEVFTRDSTGKVTSVNWPLLSASSFLTALINETLRLHPPVPQGMPRLTPPEGLTIPLDHNSTSTSTSAATVATATAPSAIHIPGNTIVSAPTYTIQRNPHYFLEPHTFIPERWTSRPDLILDKCAWCPFSLGAYGCAGKYFALMEIKLVIARLVSVFDIQFPEGEIEGMGDHSSDGHSDVEREVKREEKGQVWTEARRKEWLEGADDWMTLQPRELKLRFVRRKA